MKSNLQNKVAVVIVSMALFISNAFSANWYVKPNANGTGASWDDPCNISVLTGTPAGIADGDIVYVAAGDYSRSTQLSITKYISVLGGYPSDATGTDVSGRNITLNKSRFIPVDGGTSRCFNINTGATTAGNKVVLDGLYIEGFTMTTGNAGTALLITASQTNIEITNCEFKNNVSLNANGGAISMSSFAYNVTISFENCNFINNQATYTTANGYGGVAYFNNGTTAKTINFTNCNFNGNSAYGRGGALYFTSVITCNITDCVFNDNVSTNTTDNYSNGNGACIYVAGGTASNTFNLTRTIITGSYGTAKGSVFWFNTTPKNYLNLTNCSLIGNYAKRTTSARAAIDADNLTTNIEVTLNGCVLSNYNWSGGAKASNRADLIFLSTPSSNGTATTFTNSILNGTYFASGNAYDAVDPVVLYATTGYLADTTINLALSGDLKITDKIVLKKVFTAANEGTYTHAQIFDVKKKMGFPMTLQATIPTGYILKVNGTDYSAGEKSINIPASASDPNIQLLTDPSTGLTNSNISLKYKITMYNGQSYINGLSKGNKVTVYNTSGQILSERITSDNQMLLVGNGLVIIRVFDGTDSHILKTLVK